MEAVRDLLGIGRTAARTLRIDATAVTADDLDAWMFEQPLGQTVGRAIG